MRGLSEIHHHPECAALADVLQPIAADVPTSPLCWISTPEGDYESDYYGSSWCPECAYFKARHLRRHAPRRDRDAYFKDGGWGDQQVDSPQNCAGCGIRLEYSLTSHGAGYELDHFRENPPRPDSPDDCYCIRDVLDAVEWTEAEDDWMAEEAVSIARTLIAKLEAGRVALAREGGTGE